jgi:lipopolysaccharide/colanic/teichoic acid biosynthesis glycosyltransferase
MAYGTLLVFLILELVSFVSWQWITGPIPHAGKLSTNRPSYNISHRLLLVDFLILIFSVASAIYIKHGSLTLSKPYCDLLLILLGLWLGSSLFAGKYRMENLDRFSNALGAIFRSSLFMAAGLALVVFLFRLQVTSRLLLFAPVVLVTVLEIPSFWLYCSYRKNRSSGKDLEDAEDVRAFLGQALLESAPERKVKDPAREKLRHALEFFSSGMFGFLEKHIHLDKIDRADCVLLSTDNLFNLEVLEDRSSQLIINLHKINDVRWFNRYFLLSHKKLQTGGYLVGMAHTPSTHLDYYRKRYPYWLGICLYGGDFLWQRVFPKVPWLQKFYFAVTKGKNRAVSRAEILGRLIFCGFDIVAEVESNFYFYFIARKTKMPSANRNPTYGPLVRLRRSGLGGTPIIVYKFRTMYPFSEYLQEYLYRQHSLEKGGKFRDDFRVTGWGRFMRKCWLDELPMLYNWLRGDLGLIGVRPLSRQYLSLYTPEARELRQKVKPGLLPPFYADMPTTLEEIMESEKKYILAYLDHPLRTQMTYFWKCFYNIVIKRKRSA